MKLSGFPFSIVDWMSETVTLHAGARGTASWRTRHFGEARVRLVEYSPGYVADHWCRKGHVLLCLEGDLTTRLQDGSEHQLEPGMSYQVADHDSPHLSFTEGGAKLFILD